MQIIVCSIVLAVNIIAFVKARRVYKRTKSAAYQRGVAAGLAVCAEKHEAAEQARAWPEPDIRFLEQPFQRLTIGENEKLVVTYPGRLSDDARERLLNDIIRQFPGVNAIVLDEGMQIGVVAVAKDADDKPRPTVVE